MKPEELGAYYESILVKELRNRLRKRLCPNLKKSPVSGTMFV